MSGLDGAAERDARTSSLTPLEAALVATAVVGGLVLRFWAPSALWLDEALSVNIAALPIGDIPDALRNDGHPPLFYLLLHGWLEVAGDSDAGVRALSGLLGVLLLPLALLLGREVGGRRAGWLALALTAASPYAIRYSTEARMYALVMLLAAAAALLVRRALRGPTPAQLVGVALLTAALLLTHYWAIWAGGATAIVLLVVARRHEQQRPAALQLLGALAVGALGFVPWLGAFLHQAAHTGTPWAPPTRPSVMLAMTIADLGGGLVRDAEVVGMLLVLLVLLGLLARPVDATRIELDLRTVPGVRGEAAVVALVLALGGVTGFIAATTYTSRYAAVVAPVVLVVAAVGLDRVPAALARGGLLGALVLGGLAVAAVNGADDRTQSGSHAEAIEAVAGGSDVVVVCPDQLGPSVRRGLAPDRTVLAYPLLDDGVLVDWSDYEQRNRVDPAAIAATIEERVPDDVALFVVWSADYRTLEGQCEALVASLAVGRPDRTTLVAADAEIFEHSTVTRFGPRSE